MAQALAKKQVREQRKKITHLCSIMKTICIHGDARVLTPYGRYISANKLKAGHLLVNQQGRPYQVLGVSDQLCKSFKCLKTNLWHHEHMFPESSRFQQHPESLQLYGLPKSIHWCLPNSQDIVVGSTVVSFDYCVGYVIGCFLACGFAENRTVTFIFARHDHAVNKFLECWMMSGLSKCSALHSSINKTKQRIVIADESLVAFFNLFVSKDAIKHLPPEFMCIDKPFMSGVRKGYMENEKESCNIAIFELMVFVSYLLNPMSLYKSNAAYHVPSSSDTCWMTDILEERVLYLPSPILTTCIHVSDDSPAIVVNNLLVKPN
jgi:hypothetical protein